jgi:preprotein translocase subunit SecG
LLTGIVIGVHVVVSFLLILLILLHSGRGGGLSDLFGGAGSVAAGSTVVERNLDRITIGVAVIFAFTTVSLAMRLS